MIRTFNSGQMLKFVRSMSRIVRALTGTVLVASACKDSPTGPPAVESVSISAPSSVVVAGTSQQLSAVVKAADGTVLTDRTVAWTTPNAAVATVSTSGLFFAVAPGNATVVATVEGKTASRDIAVVPIPVATVTLSPISAPLTIGDVQQVTAVLRDAIGTVITNARVITWNSSDPTIASVSSTGVVTALASGTTAIIATSEGKTGTIVVSVVARGPAPVITSIVPATLVPGTMATINGLRFDTLSTGNTVLVRGVAANILSASGTQLSFVDPCVNTGNASVTVTTGGLVSAAATTAVATTSRTIPVGQAVVVTNNVESVCTELVTSSPTARYLVAVFSAATSQNTLLNFEIGGNTLPAGAIAPIVSPRANVATRVVDSPDDVVRDDAHWQMLERDRAQYAALRLKAQSMPSSLSRPTAALRSAAVPVVGDMRNFFFTFSGGCNATTTIMRAKAIFVGDHSVVWEDSANTVQSAANPDYLGYIQRIGQIFDADQYESLKRNFGDPLLRDPVTDADGRVHMVFSQKLNGTGAAAYVTSCDQFPRTVAPGSNFGEVFYGSVPVNTGSNVASTNFPDGWFYFMARTVVHEVKHIVSVAARVQNNSPTSEQSWLEEGTARHAEELWVRESLHHVNWKANTGFGSAATNGIYCDFHPLDATCNALDPLRRPSYGMRRQFNEIRPKLLSPWDWSPYGDATGQTGSVFYQTTWSLVRYAIDRYATTEPAFFKALINSATSGTTNLAGVAGVSMDQLIGGWGLALFADDYPGLTSPSNDLLFQTWNLRSIYAGLNQSPNWVASYPTAFPIAPVQLKFGSFSSVRNGLRGGAHSYYEISGTSQPVQLLQLRGVGGTVPSANLRIAIARLQ